MNITPLVVGQLQTNCYFLTENGQALIIDPGDDADLIIEVLQREKLQPTAIFATHGHFDHLMAAYELQEAFKTPFYIDQKDQFLLDRLQSTAEHFLGKGVVAIPPRKITHFPVVTGRDPLRSEASLSLHMETILTPGHTPGSVSFYFPKDKVIFAGDVIFAGGGVGRTDFAYCSKQDLQQSIHQLLELPSDTVVYPGHGEEFKLSNFK